MNIELPGTATSPAAQRAPATSRPVVAAGRGRPEAGETSFDARPEQLRQAVASANRALVEKSRELTFEFDDDVRRVIVKLIDRKTGEVLRQIPSSEVIEIARLLENQRGVGALLRSRA